MRTDKTLLPLSEAAELTPGRPHPSSLWRAARKGVRARDGRRIYLEHRRWGSRLYTTAAAIDRFSAALAEADRAAWAAGDGPRPVARPAAMQADAFDASLVAEGFEEGLL